MKGVKKKRGISPVVATVLLVAMVIVIALIIFLWFRGLQGEVITKFGQNIELTCEEAEFYAEFDTATDELRISNIGNIPIFGMKLKMQKPGSYETVDLKDVSQWPGRGISQGGAFSGALNPSLDPAVEKIVLTPVLIGTSDKGERTFTCNEGRFGQEIII
ncbi:hypothetical protein HYT23_05960 [Candidatus Pacearchaeota archaeon]|nr:hypothetical protein [Candidatus Pacearchaeota archaeon]